MKLNGIAGTGSGKLGSQVYASAAGQQIVRQYQANVSNPNTAKQVNQRARMKLLSQLSAVYEPVLAFSRKGLVSARNQFVKKNFELSSGNDGQAQLTIENLQLTAGSAGLPGIYATLEGGLLTIRLNRDATMVVDRVVYSIFRKTSNNQLALVRSEVVTNPGENGTFPLVTGMPSGDKVLYAYGMKDLNANASARYGNYTVESGEDIAKLFMSRALSFSDYRFTRTRGCQMYSGDTTAESLGPNQARIYLTPSGPGEVQGAGIYTRGTLVQLEATPREGSTFIGWLNNGTQQFVAYTPTIQVEASALVDLVAIFQDPESSTGGYNGNEYTNPLPGAYAEVVVDGTTYNVAGGNITLATTFDELGISNIGDTHDVVYVPEGSNLGDDDNIALEPGVVTGVDYGMQESNTGSGSIFIDGMLWFYINTPNEQPWLSSAVAVNGTTVTITNGKVQVASEEVASISIQNWQGGGVVRYTDANGNSKTFDPGRTAFEVLNVTAPGVVYVNGFKFFELVLPPAFTNIEVNGNPWNGDVMGETGVPAQITGSVNYAPLNSNVAMVLAEHISNDKVHEDYVTDKTNQFTDFSLTASEESGFLFKLALIGPKDSDGFSNIILLYPATIRW